MRWGHTNMQRAPLINNTRHTLLDPCTRNAFYPYKRGTLKTKLYQKLKFGAGRELRNKYAASASLAPMSNGQNTGRPSVARNIGMKSENAQI